MLTLEVAFLAFTSEAWIDHPCRHAVLPTRRSRTSLKSSYNRARISDRGGRGVNNSDPLLWCENGQTVETRFPPFFSEPGSLGRREDFNMVPFERKTFSHCLPFAELCPCFPQTAFSNQWEHVGDEAQEMVPWSAY